MMPLIKRNLSMNMKGKEVKLLHDVLTRLGYVIPSNETEKNLFGSETKRAVIEFQEKHNLEKTGIVDEATINKLRALPKTEGEMKVSGKILTVDGVAARGLNVIAFDKSLVKDVLLGQVITDESGNYTISYTEEVFQKPGKQNADLQIRVVDPEDNSKVYGTSAVHYNAGNDEKINLILQTKRIEKRSEYQQITSDLKIHIGKVSFKDLKENKERQDISYLSNKTGWDARLVAMISLSDKYSSETGISSDFYYALFRAGIPTEAVKLYQTNTDEVKNVWEKAVEEKIIDASLKETINQNVTKFKEYRVTHLLEKVAPVGVSPLKKLLSISLPDESKQKEFVELYYNHKGDMESFWKTAEEKLGKDITDKLQLDGKLGYLTINNAALTAKFRNIIDALPPDKRTQTPVDLIRAGLYNNAAKEWDEALKDMPIPENIPGKTEPEKKKNYINHMISMLKISYPTAVVAEMVNSKELGIKIYDEEVKNRVKDKGGTEFIKEKVYQFFQQYGNEFKIEKHAIGKFLRDKKIKLDDDEKIDAAIKSELKKLSRVYQFTPSDEAFKVAWDKSLHSSMAVVQYSEQEFMEKYGKDFDNERTAQMIYAKAHQIHSTVLNIATSYLTYRTTPKIYAVSGPPVMEDSVYPTPDASPTLENLFGAMDYCTCDHCKSVLSPAAYLVNLLEFINVDGKDGKRMPLDVLLEKRPDIEHIQLTCENTDTVLPYVDLVNEILEFYIVHPDKNNPTKLIQGTLDGYEGYNIQDEIATAELLASPQFVNDKAYEILKDQVYPFNLPFNRPLEALRLYYDHLKVPLYEAMEKLRVDDNLDTPGGANQPPYAWREIYNEYLGISKEEYKILTDSGTKKLPAYFGVGENMAFSAFDIKCRNAKVFTRTTGITYNELIEILKTQFINPNSHLIPKLEKLSIGFADIKAFKDGTLTEADFINKIPSDLDLSQYGGDVKKWIKDNNNYDKIMNLILLTDINQKAGECKISEFELRYSLPDNNNNYLKETDYWRLFRFIRLWKKLGWSVEETDKTINALYKAEFRPVNSDSEDTKKTKLDNGFKDLLIKITHVKRVKEKLNMSGKDSLIKLLALWAEIDTHGSNSLYKKMFLRPSILKIDGVFIEDGYGEFLQDANEKVAGHLSSLQAAFNVTAEELSFILEDANFDSDTALSLKNVSVIYRYSLLARALKLSMEDFVSLKTLSGINPFLDLEDVRPSTLQFIELAQLIKQSDFKISSLNYFLRHEDATGKASPSQDSILSFAKTIKDGLVRIEQENKVEDDPTGEITKSKMALVYDNSAVDKFFGLLKGTSSYSADYTHPQAELEQDLKDISVKLTCDHFKKLLTFEGVMTADVKAKYEDPNTAPSATVSFKAAIKKLYDDAQKDFEDFFDKYADLKKLYDAYAVSIKSDNEKFGDILKDFLPDLKKRLKQLFVKQTLGSSTGTDIVMLNQLLEKQGDDKIIMHSVKKIDTPAIEDFLDLETSGVSAQYFFADNISSAPDKEESAKGIDFNNQDNKLPANPAGANMTVSAIWHFYLEVPNNENYNFYIETDIDAGVKISVDSTEIKIVDSQNKGIWQNQEALELKTGKLYKVRLEITKVKDKAILKWESKGLAKESIPAKYLYPYETFQNFTALYLRVLKAIALLEGLKLNEKEIQVFNDKVDFQIDGNGFLNAIPVASAPDPNKVTVLFNKLMDLLRYAGLKESLKIKDETLATVLNDPSVKNENGESLLLKITEWDETSESDLLNRFKWAQDNLKDLKKFLKVNKAFEIIKKMGISGSQLLKRTTNQPDAAVVRDIQNTMRTKYDESAWLTVLQPINDKLRGMQRDALVAYVLHLLQQNSKTESINTSDKLFEYFLIDVEMEPCMKTSRIKQAISTVQLFIQRCLMNLEQDVSPASIKIKQWDYRKRYRLDEASKKIFLYPENWLEPELRDNKSPFFRDLEGELLQADITDELAETAFLNYLEKLDDISKLEICSMYLEEDKTQAEFVYKLHIFGRTTGASRKYYYRRCEYDGFWTPWEKVDLDIEDNPILPVVWKDRLFLFWLNIVKKGSDGKPLPEKKGAIDLTTDDLNNPSKESIEINLSWSEYFNNKWQPRKTSDFNNPIKLKKDFNPNDFVRKYINISSLLTSSEDLIINISYLDSIACAQCAVYKGDYYFKLFNKHSPPIRNEEDSETTIEPLSQSTKAFPKCKGDAFIVDYTSMNNTFFCHEVLKKYNLYEIVQPDQQSISNVFETPFAYQDRKYVFFVKPDESLTAVRDHCYFGFYIPELIKALDFHPVWTKPIDIVQPIIKKPPIKTPIGICPNVVTPSLIEFLDVSNPLKKTIETSGTVTVGDLSIGPLGSQYAALPTKTKQGNFEIGISRKEGGVK